MDFEIKDKQGIINKLSEIESLARQLTHTYVRNLAGDEMENEDIDNLRMSLNELSKLAKEGVGMITDNSSLGIDFYDRRKNTRLRK
jgi:hypothetical protein